MNIIRRTFMDMKTVIFWFLGFMSLLLIVAHAQVLEKEQGIVQITKVGQRMISMSTPLYPIVIFSDKRDAYPWALFKSSDGSQQIKLYRSPNGHWHEGGVDEVITPNQYDAAIDTTRKNTYAAMNK